VKNKSRLRSKKYIKKLTLTVRTKISLFKTLLLQTALFFALITMPIIDSTVFASGSRTNAISAPLNVSAEVTSMNVIQMSWESPLIQDSAVDVYQIETTITTNDGLVVEVRADGSEVEENVRVSNDGSSINIVLYNDPNLILEGTFYVMVAIFIGYVIHPYIRTSKMKKTPLVS